MYDCRLMADALAAEAPWPIGEGHGYHVNTLGFMMGELVRRVSGEGHRDHSFAAESPAGSPPTSTSASMNASSAASPTTSFRASQPVDDEEIGPPDGGRRQAAAHADARLHEPAPGIGARDRERARVAVSARCHRPKRAAPREPSCASTPALACARAPSTASGCCARRRSSRRPSKPLPGRIGCSAAVALRARVPQLTQPERPLGPNPGASGTSAPAAPSAYADPDARLAFAYVMNRSGPRWQNPRTGR